MSDPQTDRILLALKGTATRGGEHGPLYDQGVLYVIAQIEQSGFYMTSRLLPLIDLGGNPELARSILSSAERRELEQELASRGWSPAQGAEYAAGISAAENMLEQYRAPV